MFRRRCCDRGCCDCSWSRNVGIAVPVVVARQRRPFRSPVGHACLSGNVGECAVAVVPVKPVAQRRVRSEEVAGTAVDEENVHPAVVVEIEKCASSPGGFRQVIGSRPSIGMCPGDAGLRGCNRLKEGRGVVSGAWEVEANTLRKTLSGRLAANAERTSLLLG